MKEIPIQFASRYIKRKQSTAIGKSLLKTLTEPITNSDDNYRKIVESEKISDKKVFPVVILIDKPKRIVRITDNAQGMSPEEIEEKFKKYGAAKSAAYEGFSSRGIFGQGLSDVLFYHKNGQIKSIKDRRASICKFYWKNDKQYIKLEEQKGPIEKTAKDWQFPYERGTIIEFTLDDTSIHEYENLIKKLRVFYMLRLINNNDKREIKLVYKEEKRTRKSIIRYDFPKGKLVEHKEFLMQFENYSPVTVEIELYKSDTPLPSSGDERENGLLVHDEKQAVYDQTFFGLDDLPGADKFFGFMKLVGAREIILDKINDKKHPEEILSDSRDGLNKNHDFYKDLAEKTKDTLWPILNEERRKKTNEGMSQTTLEKHRKAFEELNKLYEQLTGEDSHGVIKSKKRKKRPVGGLEFVRSNITITNGKRYGLQLLVDTNIIEPGSTVKLKSEKNKVGLSPFEFVVPEPSEGSNGVFVKTIVITAPKARVADTLVASYGEYSASVVVAVVTEVLVYPENGMIFSPDYLRTQPKKDTLLKLYVDLETIKPGSMISLSSSNENIVLKETKVKVPKRSRYTNEIGMVEVPFIGQEENESGVIEATFKEISTQCRVDIKNRVKSPPDFPVGKFKDWDFDDSVPAHLQTTFDSIDGSPTQGYIFVNSNHPINKYYFGENPVKNQIEESQIAQLYLAELVLNEALGGMVNEAYQKGIIPQNYGPGVDIPVYIAQQKFELGTGIYDLFVEKDLSVHDKKRRERLDSATKENETSEKELLEDLDKRTRMMVEMYFGLGEQRKHTLEEVGRKFKVTRERVRQIINKALAPISERDIENEEITRDYIKEEELRLKSAQEQLIAITAKTYGLKVEDLYLKTRKPSIVIPRQVIMFLLRQELNLSFPSIARIYDMDHTTVMYAHGKVAEFLKTDKKLQKRVKLINEQLDLILAPE